MPVENANSANSDKTTVDLSLYCLLILICPNV